MERSLDAQTLIKPARFAHAVLRVRDLEESIAWYETVVGMRVVHRGDVVAFLTFDAEHHRIALLQTPETGTAPEGAVGLDHLAYAFDDLGELLSTYERLKAKGILPALPINHGPTTSLYYRDPNGVVLELFVDNFATASELKAWMESEVFAKNPLGVPFDPEKLVERYRRGDALEELVEQGSA